MVLGKTELWHILKTTDKTIVQTRYLIALQLVEQGFTMVRAKLNAGEPVSLSGFDVEWCANNGLNVKRVKYQVGIHSSFIV